MSSLTRRLMTSSVGVPAALAVVFYLPSTAALGVFLVLFLLAAGEFITLVRPVVPSAPLRGLLVMIPLAVAAGFLVLRGAESAVESPSLDGAQLGFWLIAAFGLLVVATALTALLCATEIRDGAATMGIFAFAVPYFAIPPLHMYWLKAADPWLLAVLLLMIWSGDTAAYFVGKAVGRIPLASQVSPNKTVEGAIASLVAALLVVGIWSSVRLGAVTPGLLVVAALASVAAQMGDLVESIFKRGAGVKDSSDILPGHGGFFDRLDALFLGVPVFAIGLWILGVDSLIPKP